MIYDTRHGGPYDRGSADKYYNRPRVPHYYEGATSMSKRIERADMSEGDIEAYNAGYDEQDEQKSY